MNIPTSDFVCKRCGRCCLKAGEILNITLEDVKRWGREGREDILAELILVRFRCDNCRIAWGVPMGPNCLECGKEGERVFYWRDKRYPSDFMSQVFFGHPRCPFLKKVRRGQYLCLINETKPVICREFPKLEKDQVTGNEEECQEWGCKGYLEWKKRVRGE